jgi:hypothetical protein
METCIPIALRGSQPDIHFFVYLWGKCRQFDLLDSGGAGAVLPLSSVNTGLGKGQQAYFAPSLALFKIYKTVERLLISMTAQSVNS